MATFFGASMIYGRKSIKGASIEGHAGIMKSYQLAEKK
jgi:hypothetical protein